MLDIREASIVLYRANYVCNTRSLEKVEVRRPLADRAALTVSRIKAEKGEPGLFLWEAKLRYKSLFFRTCRNRTRTRTRKI